MTVSSVSVYKDHPLYDSIRVGDTLHGSICKFAGDKTKLEWAELLELTECCECGILLEDEAGHECPRQYASLCNKLEGKRR